MRYLLVAALLVGCADKGGDDTAGDRIADVLALTGDEANGEALFADCTGCHGSDGSGGSGPSLVEEVPEKSSEEILEYVIYGEDDMPAFDSWTDQELADLLAYLRATFG